MIKVVRTGTTVDGENLQNISNVNWYRILNALLYLKEHNSLYADITIKESNLDWIVGSQSQCLQHVIQVESNNDVEEENDKGPSYHQVLEPQEELTDPGEEFYGCISENKTQIIYDGDRDLIRTIEEKIEEKKLIDWIGLQEMLNPFQNFQTPRFFV